MYLFLFEIGKISMERGLDREDQFWVTEIFLQRSSYFCTLSHYFLSCMTTFTTIYLLI